MDYFQYCIQEKIARSHTHSLILHDLFKNIPFSACKNVHLTQENAVNICNNFFYLAKKVFGNKLKYKNGFYININCLVYFDMQQYQLSFVKQLVALEEKDSMSVEMTYVINAKKMKY